MYNDYIYNNYIYNLQKLVSKLCVIYML